MKKINYFYAIQETAKPIALVFSILNYLNSKKKIFVIVDNKKDAEALIPFLNTQGINACGFKNDLSFAESNDGSFVYFHDKNDNFDFSQIEIDSIVSFFCEDNFEKIKGSESNFKNISNDSDSIDYVDVLSKFPFRTIQKIKEDGGSANEISFENKEENKEERITKFVKKNTKNNFSPALQELFFWCSEQTSDVLSNIICNLSKSITEVSVNNLMNVVLNRYSAEARREEREQFKKSYEIILSSKNKDNLNEEKIRSFFLLNPSIKNEDITNVYINENKIKIEMEILSSKQVLKYIVDSSLEDEFLKIENISAKFAERRDFGNRGGGGFRRNNFSRDGGGRSSSYSGGGAPRRSFSRDGGGSRDGNGGGYERRSSYAPRSRDGGGFKPRENSYSSERRDSFASSSSDSSTGSEGGFEQRSNNFTPRREGGFAPRREGGSGGGYQKSDRSGGFNRDRGFDNKRKFEKRYTKDNDGEEKDYKKSSGFKRSFDF